MWESAYWAVGLKWRAFTSWQMPCTWTQSHRGSLKVAVLIKIETGVAHNQACTDPGVPPVFPGSCYEEKSHPEPVHLHQGVFGRMGCLTGMPPVMCVLSHTRLGVSLSLSAPDQPIADTEGQGSAAAIAWFGAGIFSSLLLYSF